MSLLARYPNHATVAEDLTQETLFKACRSASSFRGEAKLTTWLGRIARNVFLDYRGREYKRHNEKTVFFSDLSELDEPSYSPSENQLHFHMARHLIKSRLERLTKSDRKLILMHLAGQSYHQMQKTLHVPLGTVKSRLNRGYKLLREPD
jgi:RNA polymerase sigma-70 factor (ECF subfamily)